MTFRTLVITALSLLLAVAVQAQTSIYVGGGPSVYSAPDAAYAGNLTLGICTSSGATCSLTSYEARGTSRDLSALVYSMATGISQQMAKAEFGGNTAVLFSLAQVGAAVTNGAAGGAFAGGGGITFHPRAAPNWGVTFALRGVYSPVNPGWKPWAGVQVGYTFRGQ